MARLIILLGPVASSLGGIVLGFAFEHLIVYAAKLLLESAMGGDAATAEVEDAAKDTGSKKDKKANKHAGKKGGKGGALAELAGSATQTKAKFMNLFNSKPSLLIRLAVGAYLIYAGRPKVQEFYKYSHEMAEAMSQPSIMFKATLRNGEKIIVDDYREAYWWLRDNTPKDARVMAWWDYGYQIAGIGERTTIADGNTWNHEHIATLGRTLTSPEKRAHRIARHIADYVLVWAGGGGDDLAKSPHMARIGNSVYNDICPGDPTCSNFGFYQGGIPTPMMRESLLYKLTQYGYKEDVSLDPNRFSHAFTSKYVERGAGGEEREVN
jgi:dolichyl-diphosphooligosaccharide--protein glycosyltransferase